MRFKPNQKVVCVRPNKPYIENNKHWWGPKFNEIVTIDRYSIQNPKSVELKEYPQIARASLPISYREEHFAPILDDKVITELLEESFQEQTQHA